MITVSTLSAVASLATGFAHCLFFAAVGMAIIAHTSRCWDDAKQRRQMRQQQRQEAQRQALIAAHKRGLNATPYNQLRKFVAAHHIAVENRQKATLVAAIINYQLQQYRRAKTA